jgi:FMN phosphatase YigB (HAD superfamily)
VKRWGGVSLIAGFFLIFAVRELHGREGEVYMVGDTPEADVKRALNAGLKPISYSPNHAGVQGLPVWRRISCN